ncbi:MAG: glycosyltransferase family 4 protein [Anaerolineae bacterium]|nr:glycosyltransferase family 4 protein [Anaerolineae bacterium]
MKVLVVSWEYPPFIHGGLGQHVKELLPALLATDPLLELHVVAPAFEQPDSIDSYGRTTVHWVSVSQPHAHSYFEDVAHANIPLAATARSVAETYGPFDVLHVHDWLASWAAFTVQDLHGTPLVATVHATERGRYRGQIHSHMSVEIDRAEAELCRRADQIIVCSSAMMHELERYFGVGPAKITVIPNGIDGSRFVPLRAADLKEFRARYAQPHEQIVFNVGRLVYEKGADLLIEAVPAVLREAPDTKFVIAGKGPLLHRLERRVAELQVESCVTLAGFLDDDDRDRLYVVADCSVFPSRYEPFGIVALESMAAGTPVIVTDVGGLGSVVLQGKTGLKAAPENVADLAEKLTQVLVDHTQATLLADNALGQVEECFSWQVIAALTLRVYASAIAAAEPP